LEDIAIDIIFSMAKIDAWKGYSMNQLKNYHVAWIFCFKLLVLIYIIVISMIECLRLRKSKRTKIMDKK